MTIATRYSTKARKTLTPGSLNNLVIDDVVDDVIETKPSASIKVQWATGVSAEQGNELTPTQVKDEPKISWVAKNDRLYLLAMVDPDAPARMRQIAHALIANIPGNDIAKGDTLIEYVGSGPLKGTGLHRYVFVVYEQPKRVQSKINTSKTSLKDRVNFSLRRFAKQHKLGEPVAANYFKAQYDDYVPQLHAQLAGGMMTSLRSG